MFQDEELEDITQHLPFQFFLLEVGTSESTKSVPCFHHNQKCLCWLN